MNKIKFVIYEFLRDVFSLLPGIYLGPFIRLVFYKLYLKKVGKKLTVDMFASIYSPQNIEFGDYVRVRRSCWVNGGGGLTVGDGTGLGPYTIIHTSNHNYSDKDTNYTKQGHTHKAVFIGKNVWVGARSTILPGASIGDGCVVAAGSVVPGKEFPPNTVIAGVPAKVIKSKF